MCTCVRTTHFWPILSLFFLHACGMCGTRGTENGRKSSVIHILLVINMNMQRTMPNTRKDTLPDSLRDCVVCSYVCVSLYLSVHVFDFERIHVFMQ